MSEDNSYVTEEQCDAYLDDRVREWDYAQFIADHIDVTVLLKYRDGLSEGDAARAADIFLRDEGWQGRKYPLDFFTVNSFLNYRK